MGHIRGLGYLRVQSRDLQRFRELAVGALGLQEVPGPLPEALHLRMDERASRLVVVPGGADALLAVGWEVRDQFALAAVGRALNASGTPVRELDLVECAQRQVEAGIRFADPSGSPVEVFFGPGLDHSMVRTGHGQRFATGELGMGHVVLPTAHVEESVSFYTEVLGFLPRGSIRLGTVAGPKRGRSAPMAAADEALADETLLEKPERIRFLGLNSRHHSLALCPASPDRVPGILALGVEVDTLDAVGMALDAVEAADFSLSSTLGRHTNDRMVSFYVRVPGGWDVQYGTDSMRIDEATYTSEEITRTSFWGHSWRGPDTLGRDQKPQSQEFM
ncbi:VOC family protein [Nocardioides alcanivorans]|uniref:VOC family protein n=1 Tax=Nocardioides alcanivorans TaxID=2897352 RepID=UPI001F1E9568|nr:VOC family protein [Nocardioides alcanivorans]